MARSPAAGSAARERAASACSPPATTWTFGSIRATRRCSVTPCAGAVEWRVVRRDTGRYAMPEPALGTSGITQVGIIVRDIEAAARAWSEVLGLPMPEIEMTDPVEVTQVE